MTFRNEKNKLEVNWNEKVTGKITTTKTEKEYLILQDMKYKYYVSKIYGEKKETLLVI